MKKSAKAQLETEATDGATRQSKSRAAATEILAQVSTLKDSLKDVTSAVALLSQQLSEQNRNVTGMAEILAEVREATANMTVTAPALSEAAAVTTEEPTAVTELDEIADKTSEWDRIRAAFMEEHDSTETRPTEEPAVSPPEMPALKEPEDDNELDELLSQLPTTSVVPECPIEMKKVIIDRDRTISTLVRRLQKQIQPDQVLTAEQLAEIVDSLPEELADRVETSLKAVDQQVRLGELELSLERARVSRQLSRLEETRDRLEHNARTLGLSITADGLIEGETMPARNSGSKGRRWLGVLGFGN